MRYDSLRDIDFDGHDIRVWCLRCARGAVADGAIWERFLAKGWAIGLPDAAKHFRCARCGRHDAILIVPARRIDVPPRDWASEVEAYFHATRARRKWGGR